MFEKVNPSHPDKLADRIAGAVVDIAYAQAPDPRIAVEVLLGHGICHIIAETSIALPLNKIEAAVERIAGKVAVDYAEVAQDRHLAKNQEDGFHCGDNGIFKGMPVTDEQRELTRIAREIYNRYGSDGKYILDVDRLIICQSYASDSELSAFYPMAEINPLGEWMGGTDVDTGATNRKLGSDMADSVTGGGLCVSGDTEYLGEDLRWHKIEEYDGSKVGQWNEGVLEFVQPLRYVRNEKDTLILFHNDQKLSMCLTPYHQMLLMTSKGNYVKRNAGAIAEKLKNEQGNAGFIPHSFIYGERTVSRYKNDKEIRLQVAFCADGCIINQPKWKGRIRVKKEKKKQRLRELLDGTNYKETVDGAYSIFWINPGIVSKSIRDCFTGEDLSIVYDELFKWDGDEERRMFRTTVEDDADFAQFIIASQGKVATIHQDHRVGQKKNPNGYIFKSTLYTVAEMKSTTTRVRSRRDGKGYIFVEYLPDTKRSYCFEVPSHNLVLRHNKRIFITGNCGKDLSKADVSVNIWAWLKAQETGKPVEVCCAIGDDNIAGVPFSEIVETAREYIRQIGGFEKFAEWGLVR